MGYFAGIWRHLKASSVSMAIGGCQNIFCINRINGINYLPLLIYRKHAMNSTEKAPVSSTPAKTIEAPVAIKTTLAPSAAAAAVAVAPIEVKTKTETPAKTATPRKTARKVVAKPVVTAVVKAVAKSVKTAVTAPAKTVAKTPKNAPVEKLTKVDKKVTIKVAAKATPKLAPKAAAKAALTVAPKAAVKPKVEKLVKAKKPKLVRDSFTIPKAEFNVFDELKTRAGKLGNSTKKSELIRAGIKALASMADAAFLLALKAVPAIKTGRPAKE